MTWMLVGAVLVLTFANGANDNFKGVATLFGSGTASYRQALAWATFTTGAGSVTALLLAGTLVARFTGKDLVPDALTADPAFLTAVGGGAAMTVLLASRLGLPISTTHALTGALVGAGLPAAGEQLRLSALGRDFLAPLFLSPFLAAILIGAIHAAIRAVRRGARQDSTCVCVATPAQAHLGMLSDSVSNSTSVAVVSSVSECVGRGLVPAITTRGLLDFAHYLSAGAVGFARGVNDTPKLLALIVPLKLLAPRQAVVLLAAVMAVGGLLGARRVAETLSHRVTTMNREQGFVSNVTTAVLVLFASRFGLPVSTTHVLSGSLFGLGAITGQARWRTIVQIAVAWVVTLPCAAVLAGVLWWVIRPA